jgi:hypothetical protein
MMLEGPFSATLIGAEAPSLRASTADGLRAGGLRNVPSSEAAVLDLCCRDGALGSSAHVWGVVENTRELLPRVDSHSR